MERGQAYWEDRAATGHDKDGFEWFTIDFQRLVPYLERCYILDPATTVLEVGCGTSHLMMDIAKARWKRPSQRQIQQEQEQEQEQEQVREKKQQYNELDYCSKTIKKGTRSSGKKSCCKLHAIDYSPTCIERQKEYLKNSIFAHDDDDPSDVTNCDDEIIQFSVMDATQLSFPDHSFDILLDKGTLDALDIVSEQDLHQTVNEYARVLSLKGTVCLVTCRVQPVTRRIACFHGMPFELLSPSSTRSRSNDEGFCSCSCSYYSLKALGEENAPGGCALIILKRMEDDYKFDVHSVAASSLETEELCCAYCNKSRTIETRKNKKVSCIGSDGLGGGRRSPDFMSNTEEPLTQQVEKKKNSADVSDVPEDLFGAWGSYFGASE